VLGCGSADLSSAAAVNVAVPRAVGFPVIAPVDGFSARPAGRAPEVTENVYGGVPPVAVIDEEYCIPTVALFTGHATVGTLAAIVIEQLKLDGGFPLISDTVTWKLNVPAADGVPRSDPEPRGLLPMPSTFEPGIE
jgi:hypothetical protein